MLTSFSGPRVSVPALLLCLAVALVSEPANAKPTLDVVDGRIVEVTVYRDRAEVVREAAVTLTPGANAVEFANLPLGVEQDSLRVSASGVPATLGTIEVRERAEQPRETAEWIAARDEVRRVEREIARLSQQEANDAQLRSFLNSLGQSTAARQAAAIGEGRADPESIALVYALLEEKLGALGDGKLVRQDDRRALDEQLAVARARLRTAGSSGAIRSRSAIVEIDAPAAGSLTIRLAYLAPGSSWQPSYRAMLDGATGDVTLVSEGVVRQESGEDWTDVRLRLSSASPAMGVEPPALRSWYLRHQYEREIVETVKVSGAIGNVDPGDQAVAGRFYQNVLQLAPGVNDAASTHGSRDRDLRALPAAEEQTEVVRSIYSVAFDVPGTNDIPADGSEHRVVLRRETLPANLVHRTVPGIEDRAYLTAVTTSPRERPLLAGPVRVLADGAYLGTFPLKQTAPGSELVLPFGADNRVEIVRVPEPEVAGVRGFGGKNRVVDRTHLTRIHNLLDRETTLVLEERLPVAEQDQIEVALGKATTPGYEESARRPGVKLWTVKLAAGEKRELRFDYTVKYPGYMNLPGLER